MFFELFICPNRRNVKSKKKFFVFNCHKTLSTDNIYSGSFVVSRSHYRKSLQQLVGNVLQKLTTISKAHKTMDLCQHKAIWGNVEGGVWPNFIVRLFCCLFYFVSFVLNFKDYSFILAITRRKKDEPYLKKIPSLLHHTPGGRTHISLCSGEVAGAINNFPPGRY